MTGTTDIDCQRRSTATATTAMATAGPAASSTASSTAASSQPTMVKVQPPRRPGRPPGTGILHLASPRPRSHLTTLLASYPLKLLSPTPLHSQPPHLALAYILAYGGGLVAGDIISLSVAVDAGSGLVLLTQGSTKVFKARPGLRPQSHVHANARDGKTRQRMHVTLENNCFALVLPDSTSSFRGSQYVQSQRFVLPRDASSSVLVLDWVNSGRGQQASQTDPSTVADVPVSQYPEVWSMESYTSTNEIFLGSKLIMRDRMNLVNPPETVSRTATDAPPVAVQLAPFHVYATVLICGPHLVPLLTHLRHMTDKTSQFQLHTTPMTTWSYSDIPCQGDLGGILRVAGTSVQEVRTWLQGAFLAGGIKDLVGDGLWPRVI